MRGTANDGPILEAKLLPPRQRTGWVQRGALIAELDRAAETRLTLVSAPLGSGKSMLVAQWAAAHAGNVAWLTLDSGDDAPTAFWIYVVAALRKLDPAFGDVLLRRLRAPGTALAEDILPQLANSLFELAPATLVLDDFQTIRDDEIHEGLLFLIDRLPPGLRIVIATQSDPRFGLNRLRAHGEVCEIRDLAFSADESAALLRHVLGLELHDAEVQTIHGRTEGWAAGLQLAALSARGQRDPIAYLVEGAAENRLIADLLSDELVARQPPDIRRFLVETSILERFCASLCASVTGRADAEALILDLERSNLFLMTVDAGGRWHRFHQLFAEALARQRRELPSDELADLHRRASKWYAGQDRPAEAIEHALRAGDVDFAADELARRWIRLFSEGRATMIFDWLDRLPIDFVAGHPSLSLLASGLAYALGRSETAEHWLAMFEANSPASGQLPGYPYSPEAAAAIIRGMLALARGTLGEALSNARRAHAMELDLGRILIGHHLGVILFYADDSASAEPLLWGCLSDKRTADHHAQAVTALGYLAVDALDQGDAVRARHLADDALDRAYAHDLDEYALTSVAEGALGAVVAAQGDSDGAEEHLERAVALAHRCGHSHEIALAHLQLAAGRLRQRDRQGASNALAVARAQRAATRLPRLQRLGEELTRALGRQRRKNGRPDSGHELTAAELQVLRMLPLDLTYPEMATRLFVSINTVKSHTSSIRRKLGVGSRSEAITSAQRSGLL